MCANYAVLRHKMIKSLFPIDFNPINYGNTCKITINLQTRFFLRRQIDLWHISLFQMHQSSFEWCCFMYAYR